MRYLKQIKRGGDVQDVGVEKVVRINVERWRRRINVLICDEGGLLSNLHTQQTRAVYKLAARKLIIMDGTQYSTASTR